MDEEQGLISKHQLAEIAQDLGAGGNKSHQNRMEAILGGPSEEGDFADQQLYQMGIRAVGITCLIRSWPAGSSLTLPLTIRN